MYKKIQTKMNNSQKKKNRFENIFVRLSICTAICIVTDLGFIGLSVQNLSPRFSVSFIPICYSFNMLINVVAVLASFSDFRLRFFPFHKPKVVPKKTPL